jgi:hypothetical protein
MDIFQQKLLVKEDDLSDLNNLRSRSYNFASVFKIHTLPVELYARLEYFNVYTEIIWISLRIKQK